MKKIIALCVLCFSLIGAVFAETYEVKSITGNVTYEATPGKWKPLKVGQKLTESNMLNISVQSKLVLESESGKSVSVKAMQKGSVKDLVKSNSLTKSGLKTNPSMTATASTRGAAGEDEKNAQGTGTASNRGDLINEDTELDEQQ